MTDGDTVIVLDESQRRYRIRIAGIDAPERRQAFGDRSKASLAALVFNHEVDVLGDKVDRYGRTVGKIMAAERNCNTPSCPKSVDAGLAQIKNGMAWWYWRYAREQTVEDQAAYAQAEVKAKIDRLGVWGETTAVPPWEWRAKKQTKSPYYRFRRNGARDFRLNEN